MVKPRVLVGNEHRLFGKALERLLNDNFEIFQFDGKFDTLANAAAALRPKILLTGLSTDRDRGLSVLHSIKQRAPDARIVVITMWADSDTVARAFRAGASAYLLQSSPESELMAALHACVEDDSYVASSLMSDAVRHLLSPASADDSMSLSSRQREIVKALAEGHSMKQIAATLSVSTRTVAFHKYKVMERLNIRTSAELVRYAITAGIV